MHNNYLSRPHKNDKTECNWGFDPRFLLRNRPEHNQFARGDPVSVLQIKRKLFELFNANNNPDYII